MTRRISISLEKKELEALLRISEDSSRHPRDQIRYSLLKDLETNGYLETDSTVKDSLSVSRTGMRKRANEVSPTEIETNHGKND